MPTKMTSSKLHRFQATIYKIWMMRHVNVPGDIARALEKESGQTRHIPVVATVNSCSNRTTLVPAGAGLYRLQLNTPLRKTAGGADVGDLIGVTLAFDGASREMPVPGDLHAALKNRPKARKEFDALPPGHRRQLMLYLERAKSPQARARVIGRFLDHLLERVLLGGRASKNKRAAKPPQQRSSAKKSPARVTPPRSSSR
jgi:hypothetical protein